jgi:hypothetical protein
VIDLRQFSPPYRVHLDAGLPEGPRPARQYDDPWELVLPGAAGFVAPQGGEHLLACTRHRLTTARILATVPGAVITQDGSDGQNVKFPARHLDEVAGILRLRRRKEVSEAERERLAALSRAHSPFRKSISESKVEGHGAVEEAQGWPAGCRGGHTTGR